MKKYLLPFAAFLFLNISMNIAHVWDKNFWHGFFIAPEILLVCLALSIFPWENTKKSNIFILIVSMLLVFVSIFKIFDFAVPHFFSRSFNLYIDSCYFPDLMHFLYHSLSIWKFCLYMVFIIVTAILTFTAVYYCLRKCICFFHVHYRYYVIVLLLLFLVQITTGFSVCNKNSIHRIVEEVQFVSEIYRHKKHYLLKINNAKEKASNSPQNLKKLNKSNVFLIYIESYGHTVFEKQEHFELMQPILKRFNKSLEKNDYKACSSFLLSPTFGGNSWLAHGSLDCGVKTFNQIIFEMLLTSDIKSLAKYFKNTGYRTISAMPGTTKPWPAGKFFGFDKKYYSWDFDYRGPKYGWSPMTDQYVFKYIHEQEVKNQQAPLFVEYILISSHAPFHIQPPYIEDWNTIEKGEIYHKVPPITYPIVWPDLSNASKGYMHSIDYVFKSIEVYLDQYITDDSLVIILGDHQPHGAITGANQTWAVPIHIVSRNEEFISKFMQRQYTEGLIPKSVSSYQGMETFLYEFLEDFGEK